MLRAHEERTEIAHVPALDGLRGIAVLAVLLYHGGVSWAGGGFLGVEAFFVLSGFLITSLLVSEWLRTSTIKLRSFWARRARRLLPALFCLVAAVGVYQALAGQAHAVPGLTGDGIATLFYYGNWNAIASAGNYFVQSGSVSPLQHTWSLAIEEQFYLVWPLLLLLVLRLAARREGDRNTRTLGWLAVGSVVAAVASATEMALLYSPANTDRVYYGTDTRAQALLAGAALAFALAYFRSGGTIPVTVRLFAARAGKAVLGSLGSLGLALVFLAMWRATGSTESLYHYGLFGIDCAVVAVIGAAALVPESPPARLLSWRPLRAVGIISYGLYLWHFPLFLWLTPSATGVSGTALLAMKMASSFAVATLSYFIVEQPVRRQRVSRRLLVPLAPAGAVAAAAAIFLASSADVVSLSAQVAPPPALNAPLPTVPRTAAQGHTHPARPASWAGSGPKCSLPLADNANWFEAPPPESQYTSDLLSSVASHQDDIGDQGQVSFETCPPKRVLFIGDSLAFTLAFGMLSTEQEYGVELAGAPIDGCSFNTDGLLLMQGQYQPEPGGCATEMKTWVADEQSFRADAVVVELGWRDEFDWQVAGHDVGLGDPSFNRSVEAGIEQLVADLGEGGRVPILFLTVPLASAPPESAPAGRHTIINEYLEDAAANDPSGVGVVDIDRYVSPGGHYDRNVDGQLCRFDGLHFTQFCAEVVEPYVLGEVRQMIAQRGS
jgi:peptidoglycan/LPS O-acetylase OafA/YrhL